MRAFVESRSAAARLAEVEEAGRSRAEPTFAESNRAQPKRATAATLWMTKSDSLEA